MKMHAKAISLLLTLCLLIAALPFGAAAEEVIDAELTCTITLGNWPADTAPEAEKALFEGYKATMAKQYPNVTLVPDYYSYTLSNYVPMAKGHTAPSIFQPPFTDPQLLISQHLVGDVTDALERFGVLEQFSPAYVEMLADENGRIYGLPRDGYVLGMHINVALFREAGLVDEEGLPIYPKTLQELAEYGQIIKEKTGKAGLVFPASETYGGWLFTNIAWNFGCVGDSALEYQDEDGRWVCNFTSPECIAAMEYMRDLQWKYGILNADATTTDWAGAHSLRPADGQQGPPGGGLRPDSLPRRRRGPLRPGGRHLLHVLAGHHRRPGDCPDGLPEDPGQAALPGRLHHRGDAAGLRGESQPRRPGHPRDQYADFFDSLNNGTITLKSEEPVFAQQLYRELTAVIQRVITREGADIEKALRKAEESFQEYLDDEINDY